MLTGCASLSIVIAFLLCRRFDTGLVIGDISTVVVDTYILH